MTHRHAPADSHGHLWSTPDGVGLHAPFGGMVVEEGTGRLCCHFCGRWFISLSTHLRAHAMTADQYRADLGLSRTQPLTSPLLWTGRLRMRATYGHAPAQEETIAAAQHPAGDGTPPRLAARAGSWTPVEAPEPIRRSGS